MQPWKEFSTKQSFWQAVCLRPPAFWSRPAAEPSPQRPTRDCSRSPSPCLSPFYAPRSPKPSQCPRAYWPFRHTARRRCFVPAALAFVPLALYDCARCVHRADVLRFSGALALIAIVACLMHATMSPLSTASLLCSATAACVLSVRTSTTLARQHIAWSTRDALASQALSLRKRNRNLRDSLDRMSAIAARNDENGATGGEAAEQKSAGETVARECAREIVASKSGGGPSREPGAGVTCRSDGDARRKSDGGSETTGNARVGGGVTDDTGVGGALSDGRVKRESDGSTPGDFVHSNASHEQLRPTPVRLPDRARIRSRTPCGRGTRQSRNRRDRLFERRHCPQQHKQHSLENELEESHANRRCVPQEQRSDSVKPQPFQRARGPLR